LFYEKKYQEKSMNQRKIFTSVMALMVAGTMVLSACQSAAATPTSEPTAATSGSDATVAPVNTEPAAAATAPEATKAVAAGQKKFSVSGAFALYPLMVKWGEEYSKIHPEVVFDISAGGAGKGMTDALAGAVDVGMVSRGVTPEEEEKGAFYIGVAKDAVFATVNAKNPYIDKLLAQGISKETLTGIFMTQTITTWGQALNDPSITDEIHVYIRSDSCGAGEMWSKFLGGKTQDELKGIGVNADPGVLQAVIKDPLGIGYNNLNYAYDPTTGKAVEGAAVLAIDKNANSKVDDDEKIDTKQMAVDAVATGKYPSPPARVLNLVTKGKPTAELMDFMTWILNDGQKYVSETGYVNLTDEEMASSKDKLK
jgi:phosphate transport system substrate-binding protein